MAIQSVELQIKQISEKMRTEARQEIEKSWLLEASNRLGHPLNPQERANVISGVNKLFSGREEWLKQMREARTRVLQAKNPPEVYGVEDEKVLNTEVNKLLKTHVDFISHYKYVPDSASLDKMALNASAMGGLFGGLLPKITNALGDGPFAFIGKLLTYILNMFSSVMPVVTKIAENINPQKALDQMSPTEAHNALKKQETELLTKMDSVLSEMRGYEAIQDLLKDYRDHLSTHADGEFLKGATTQYLSDNIAYRKKMYEAFSAKAKEILSVHGDKVEMDKQIEAETKEVEDLKHQVNAIHDPNREPEKSILANHLRGLEAVLQQHQTKKRDLKKQEETLLQNFPVNNIATNLNNLENTHESLFKQEQDRQKNKV